MCLVHIAGELHKERKSWRKDQKGGRRADARPGNWQKGTGQELCDWNPCHPPHSISSNTPAQMMHENPFMLQAGREDNTESGRNIQREDGRIDDASTGIVWPKLSIFTPPIWIIVMTRSE